MPQDHVLVWRAYAFRVRTIPFWMAQAPILLVGFATFGLAVRRHWIAFALLVTCVWIYARVLRHDSFMALLDRAFFRAGVAIEKFYPKGPAALEVGPKNDDPPDPVAQATATQPMEALPAPLVEPEPPTHASARSSRRVRQLEISPTKRLLQLEELRKTGLVTAAEYQDERQEILRAI
jgi:hypothetical protein